MRNDVRNALGAMALAFGLALSATPAVAGGVTVAEEGDSKLKFGAKFFLNATRQKETTNGAVTADSTGLAVDRAYLTAKYSFDDTWMMRLTTDVQYEAGLAKKKSNIFLKYAYVEGNFSPAAQLRLGLSHTPWIDYEQHLWKHRYVSKVYVDNYKFDSSSDAGVGLKGELGDGLAEYWVAVVNGGGYGDIQATRGLDFNGRVSLFPIGGLTLDLQYRNGYKGGKTLGAVNPPKHTLYQVMASYGMDHFRVGANYVANDAEAAVTTTEDRGYDLWAWYNFTGQLGAFGRYEHKKQTVTTNATDEKTDRYVLGLEYMPRENISLSLAWDRTKVDNVGQALGQTSKSERYGLYSQIKF